MGFEPSIPGISYTNLLGTYYCVKIFSCILPQVESNLDVQNVCQLRAKLTRPSVLKLKECSITL
jgi:hypothetical protein